MLYDQEVIMKILKILAIPFMVFASGQTIPIRDHMSLHYTDNRPFLKLKKKTKMKKIAKIDKDQAENLTKKITGEISTAISLVHRGKYLVYRIYTEHYKISINAIDGTVIKQELIEGK